MDPTLARMALRQAGVLEAFSLLAYVEGYALVVGSVGVRLVPGLVARQAVISTLEGFSPWQPAVRTLPAHLRAVAHEHMADRLRVEARARGFKQGARTLSSVRMATAQIGELTGVAELAHAAGELMPFIRAGDEPLRLASVQLCEDMRRRLTPIAAIDDMAPAHTVLSSRARMTPARGEPPHPRESSPGMPTPMARVVRDGDDPEEQA